MVFIYFYLFIIFVFIFFFCSHSLMRFFPAAAGPPSPVPPAPGRDPGLPMTAPRRWPRRPPGCHRSDLQPGPPRLPVRRSADAPPPGSRCPVGPETWSCVCFFLFFLFFFLLERYFLLTKNCECVHLSRFFTPRVFFKNKWQLQAAIYPPPGSH